MRRVPLAECDRSGWIVRYSEIAASVIAVMKPLRTSKTATDIRGYRLGSVTGEGSIRG
jgi:hypothetical protein